MASKSYPPWLLVSLISMFFVSLAASSAEANEERQVYIVYMGQLPSEGNLTESHHLNLLDQVLEGSSARENLVYSYRRSFNGLAAKLTEQEIKKLDGMEGIVSVFPSKKRILHTTRSWDFLRFPETVRRNPALESDVIVGMLDTGIWPESRSFNDEGFGPPPSRWKGACESIKCNNKIIGARFYFGLGEATARDLAGHGTHTASTAAGRSVQNTSLYGLAGGTARGAVPSARIAVYKVCSIKGCGDDDILAGFDDAIADGVDIISISIGSEFGAVEYFNDPIAIGAFHAMRKGILVSASGGNEGPFRGTVSNVAPWMLVSAASSIDRYFMDKLVIGNGRTIMGTSINTFPTEKRSYPFINPAEGFCEGLATADVEGKIVFCGTYGDVTEPLRARAAGVVIVGDYLDYAFSYPLPALTVSISQNKSLTEYMEKARNPVAKIFRSEVVFDSSAPVIASFSSRGPNKITPDILKPDISAPGIDILAAWSPKAKVSEYEQDTRSVVYNIVSGTSMACPHVSGAAAYVKSFHPNWSPAAIMSALITTASPMNLSLHKQDAELAYGAGQVNPRNALHPGLVYDTTVEDYVKMLCNQGYNISMIRFITGEKSSCSKRYRAGIRDLNYPSIAFQVQMYKPSIGKFSRTVTNVGKADSIYTARIISDPKLKVTVEPKILSFRKLHEKKKFVVTVSGRLHGRSSVASASVIWSDGTHSVRSPIIAHVYTP